MRNRAEYSIRLFDRTIDGLVISAVLLVSSCVNRERPVVINGFAQGTTYTVKYVGKADSLVIGNSIDSLFRLVDVTASLWDSNSIISKVNRNEPVELNPLFIQLFNRSMEISTETSGAFDITVGPLVRVWGFYRKRQMIPDDQTIDSLRRLIGFKKVKLEGNRVVKEDPSIAIDFNAIAQGYTVDLIAALMESYGINHFLVEVGGEVRTRGHKPGDEPWVVGIEKPAPNDTAPQEVEQKVTLNGKSIATSGNSRKYIINNGRRFSHTIDPSTGHPVSHSLLSVSVIADDCMTADAYATAFMVMGLDKSMTFLGNHPGTEAFFIFHTPDGSIKSNQTAGFKTFLR